jgi:hypothetical protein
MGAIEELERVVREIEAGPSAGELSSLWKTAMNHLRRTPADVLKAGKICAARDLAGLRDLVAQLRSGALQPRARPVPGSPEAARSSGMGFPTSAPIHPMATSHRGGSGGPLEITPDVLKSALKAFRKRLKLTRLDEESRLSSRALTGGRRSSIVAIQPPAQFPREVWDALVDAGSLKREGTLYRLAHDDLT